MFNCQCGVMILSMVVVVGVVNPWTFIPVFPICFLLVIVRRYFLRTSRDVHRLEGICKFAFKINNGQSHESKSSCSRDGLRERRRVSPLINLPRPVIRKGYVYWG